MKKRKIITIKGEKAIEFMSFNVEQTKEEHEGGWAPWFTIFWDIIWILIKNCLFKKGYIKMMIIPHVSNYDSNNREIFGVYFYRILK